MDFLLNPWWAAGLTLGILLADELLLAWMQRRHPQRLARTVHARLREAWFEAVSEQPGSEVLAVQTLRNSVMSATMTASTAALGLVATVTLAAPTLSLGLAGATSGAGAAAGASAAAVAGTDGPLVRSALELLLIAQLFGALVASTMAVRYYNHAGFVCAIPVGTDTRRRWAQAGRAYVRRAGLLYSWGLRHLILVVPILVAVLHPPAGPAAAFTVALVLWFFDGRVAQDGPGAGVG